jgi:DNA excision repair protein ERCC-3
VARFAELEKSPEYLYSYRTRPLSLWNAAAAGLAAPEILGALERYSKYDVPGNVRAEIAEQVSRYGRFQLTRRNGDPALESHDAARLAEIARHKAVVPFVKRLNHCWAAAYSVTISIGKGN